MPLSSALAQGARLPSDASPAGVWLERITEHIVTSGLTDASLRRLASVAGTTHDLLRYHFGSRAGVLGAVLHSLRAREQADLFDGATTRSEVLHRMWAYYNAADHGLEMRLFFHIAGKAVESPADHAWFLDALISTWADAFTELGVREGLPRDRAEREGRLLVSAFRGLVLDRLLTRDARPVDAAFTTLVQLIAPVTSKRGTADH